MKKVLSPCLALLLAVLAGCHGVQNKDKVARTARENLAEVVDVPESAKKVAIAAEQASYNKMTKEEKALHDQVQADMKWDLKHKTWHDSYPIASVPAAPVTPIVSQPASQPAPNPVDILPNTQPQATTPPATGPPAAPSKGHKKALIVGINKYPGCPLNGCVNDAMDIRSFIKETPEKNNFSAADAATVKDYLKNSLSFTDDDITILLDADATTANITQGLLWLCADAQAGDIRLFWYSGHGAEYAGNDSANQPDHQNQVICPVDFDWTEQHMIMDVQFYKIFGTMPADVIFSWGSDSCHSGDLDKALPKKGVTYRRYPLPPPAGVAANLAAIKFKRGISRRNIVAGELNVGFLAGCNYNEFSADTQDDNGRPCGADTHFFLQTLRTPGNWNKPLTTIAAIMNQAMDAQKYDQHPQPEGFRRNKGWMQN